jgi:membrane-associated phospholipid phosphatase
MSTIETPRSPEKQARWALPWAEVVVLASCASFALVSVVRWQRLQQPLDVLLRCLLMMAMVAVVHGLRTTGVSRWREALRFVVLMFWFYQWHALAGVFIRDFGFRTYEVWLSSLDHKVFGNDLSVQLASWATPARTEVIQIAYSSFYEVIMVPTIYFIAKKKWKALSVTFATLASAHFILVGLNLLVPARWPGMLHNFPELQHIMHYEQPIQGLRFTHSLRQTLEQSTTMMWDSFPSGHTCLSLCMLIIMWRDARVLFWIFLPLVLTIVFSTAYLRYHYGVDLIAGAMLAIGMSFAIPHWDRKWEPLLAGWLSPSPMMSNPQSSRLSDYDGSSLSKQW